MSLTKSLEDALLAWASQVSPGEVERRQAWLAAAAVPSRADLDARFGSDLRSFAPGGGPAGDLEGLAGDVDALTSFLLAERAGDGSFLMTDRQVYLNLLLLLVDSLNAVDLEDGFVQWRATW